MFHIEAINATNLKHIEIIIMSAKTKQEVPFLFYTKAGVCKSNADMPTTGEAFKGWFSAANVIRNASKHSKCNISASLEALKVFCSELNEEQVIKERDLLEYI